MEKLTLETLPKAFSFLADDVSEIKRLLLEKNKALPAEQDSWFDINELRTYHPDKPSKPTIYAWVRDGIIPCHKGAKKLSFLKSEIDTWLKQGRKRTLLEIKTEAEKYVKNKKG